MEFKHFSHTHSLAFHQVPQGSEIHCSACKSPGSGNVYACWSCGHFLHEQCYHAKRSLNHPSHTLHPLTLVPYPTYQSGSFFCNSCNLGGNGLCYTCSECQFDMHVHCALLANHNPQVYPFPIPNDAHNYSPHPQSPMYPPYDNTQNFSPHSQNHTYPPSQNNVYLSNQNNQFPSPYPQPNTQPPNYSPPISTPYTNPQTQPTIGTSGSNNQNNQFPSPYPQPNTPPPNYNPTVNTPYPNPPPQPSTNNPPPAPPPYYPTAEPQNTNNPQSKPPSIIKHFSHPHILKQMELDQKAGKICSACECKLSGSAFCCTEPHCTFNLHKACFDSPLEVRHKSHLSHPLKLVTTPPYSDGFTCNACLKDGKAFAYTCATCKYDLHIDCVSWPEKVTRPDHEHTLTLYYSSPAGQTSQDVTFVCDACKNPVHELAWMYYCRECDFGTHLECVASGVKQETAASSVESVASAIEEVHAVGIQCLIEALGRQYALASI